MEDLDGPLASSETPKVCEDRNDSNCVEKEKQTLAQRSILIQQPSAISEHVDMSVITKSVVRSLEVTSSCTRLSLVRTYVFNVLEKPLSEGSLGSPTNEFLCFRDACVDSPEIA